MSGVRELVVVYRSGQRASLFVDRHAKASALLRSSKVAAVYDRDQVRESAAVRAVLAAVALAGGDR